MDHVFYSDNGSTAIEVALKIVFSIGGTRDTIEKIGSFPWEHGYRQ
jgi:adenosylmethionine-8-amino-7-oxononanoate aminotransferase